MLDSMGEIFRLASVNVNGVRAAYRKGMGQWLAACGADVVALQEVRAETAQLADLVTDSWHIEHDAAVTKGRAGVALLSKKPPLAVRRGLPSDAANTSGRWLEADYECAGQQLTVVSLYMHSGEVGTARQEEKWAMLQAMRTRAIELAAAQKLVAIVGDFNIGHTQLDIKNWRGNVKKSGFLPAERAYLDSFFGAKDAEITAADDTTVTGIGYVDVGRQAAGQVPGPYTWWSNRGQAFDNDTGWRIDYHMVTPELAARASNYRVDRYPSYDARWSDHAPVLADYSF